mmetsp:Transcript_8054/g.13519  ORF Transcript_8054/g.13519 Transcript_8054/m.13519 type:complete len:322 (+) Transcript_8054:43-1008(+)
MAQQSPKVHPLAFPKKPLPVLPPQNDVIHAPAPLPPGPGTRQSINRTSCIRKPINLVKAYAPSAPEEDYEVNAENLPTNEYIDGYYEYSDATGETFEPDGSFAVALWNFTGERDTDLNFNKGDKIKIIRRFSNGWWEGEIDNVIGDFPCNFVEIVENVDITYDEPYSQQQQEYEKFDDDSDSSSLSELSDVSFDEPSMFEETSDESEEKKDVFTETSEDDLSKELKDAEAAALLAAEKEREEEERKRKEEEARKVKEAEERLIKAKEEQARVKELIKKQEEEAKTKAETSKEITKSGNPMMCPILAIVILLLAILLYYFFS